MAGDVEWEMSRRVNDARSRARRRGIPFDVTTDYLVYLWEEQGGRCAVSGIPMKLATNGQEEPWLASIDRIRPADGYVITNLRLVTWMVNRGLSGWGDERFIEMCRAVVDQQEFVGECRDTVARQEVV